MVEVGARVFVTLYRWYADGHVRVCLHLSAREYPDLCRRLSTARWVIVQAGRHTLVMTVSKIRGRALLLRPSRVARWRGYLTDSQAQRFLIHILYAVYETEEDLARVTEPARA